MPGALHEFVASLGFEPGEINWDPPLLPSRAVVKDGMIRIGLERYPSLIDADRAVEEGVVAREAIARLEKELLRERGIVLP